LAATLTNYALFNVYERHMDEAGQRFEEAVNIDRHLAEQNSSVYLPNLAMSLSNLARVEHIQGRDHSADEHYREAYNLLESLVQRNPAYASDMGRVEASLKELQKTAGSQPPGRK
jgi:tetratricopeptide (TPR) repeat protein